MAVASLDTEIYRNLFLAGGRILSTGEIVSWEKLGSGALSPRSRRQLKKFIEENTLVGFNLINFDIPVCYAAISGIDIFTLKDIANSIINDGLKPWELEKLYGFEIPRDLKLIDLIEVSPGKASLKIYNGRVHGKRMKDLPFNESRRLTEEEADQLYEYWCNDLEANINLKNALAQQLDLRRSLSREYNLDLMSKSDAQIAEAVIKSEYRNITGKAPPKADFKAGASYRYRAPDFIRFHSEELADLVDVVEESYFKVAASGKLLVPTELLNRKIAIGDGVYRMGNGGLHSSEKQTAHVCDDDDLLLDRDVTSYYPMIIINSGLYPKHLGKVFLKIYKKIVARRVDAKIRGDKVVADTLKIVINGSFGKFGSRFSVLYSPDLLIQTTVTGQLSLLMLIDMLEHSGIKVVSANTDGIVIKVKKRDYAKMEQVVKRWESETNFETEETQYDALYSRDVNNYIAVKKGGGFKTKGAYAIPESPDKPLLNINPSMDICVEAVLKFISEGIPISKTITECSDIRKFVVVRTVKGGAVHGDPAVDPQAEYLGKAIRWYYSIEESGNLHYCVPNSKGTHNKVPKSFGAKPLMTLPDRLPDDINYMAYIREARDILLKIGYHQDLVGCKRGKSKRSSTAMPNRRAG